MIKLKAFSMVVQTTKQPYLNLLNTSAEGAWLFIFFRLPSLFLESKLNTEKLVLASLCVLFSTYVVLSHEDPQ